MLQRESCHNAQAYRISGLEPNQKSSDCPPGSSTQFQQPLLRPYSSFSFSDYSSQGGDEPPGRRILVSLNLWVSMTLQEASFKEATASTLFTKVVPLFLCSQPPSEKFLHWKLMPERKKAGAFLLDSLRPRIGCVLWRPMSTGTPDSPSFVLYLYLLHILLPWTFLLF